MIPPITIIDAINDPNIIGDTISPAQEAALKAVYGLPLAGEQLALAQKMAGSAWQPGVEQSEAVLICGRRSGKSDKIASNIAIFEAFFRDHNLSAGETGVVLLLAQNMRQAKIVMGYVTGKIENSPVLSRHVVAKRAQELELDNGITIAIHPASFRSIRGLSCVCCIADEIAFWWTEEGFANPDIEVIRAVRPAMATFPHGKLLMVSSPYTMAGVLWSAWRNRNTDPHVLVWHAPTRLMNPTVPASFLEKEKAKDPENYRREYEAEFIEAVSGFLLAEQIQQCVVPGRTELPPDNQIHYVAAIDAAFKGDRFTMAVVHQDEERIVVDCLRGWQGSREHPLRLKDVMPQIKEIADRYGLYTIFGDQFGAEPLKDAFERRSMQYEERPFTNASKADIYGTLRTLITDCQIELLDHEPLLKELRGLEIELLPGGSIRIGHGRSGRAHDDYSDALALAVSEANQFTEWGHGYAVGGLECTKFLDDPRIYSEGFRNRWGRHY